MLTPKNNVLTETGWKNITELRIGEEILTTNFAGHGIFSPILNIIEHDFDGHIYEYTNHEKGFLNSHISVTEGTVIPTRKVRKLKSFMTGQAQTFSVMENKVVDDLANKKERVHVFFAGPLQYNVDEKTHKAGVIKHGSVKMVDVDYFKFLAYIIFRTAIMKQSRQKYSSLVSKIRVRNHDDPTVILQLLDQYNIPYRIDITHKKGTNFVGRYIAMRDGAASARALRRIIGNAKISERTIPDVVMQSKSPSAIMAFLVEAVRINKKNHNIVDRLPTENFNFTVSNETLANQLIELFHKVGYAVRTRKTGFGNPTIELAVTMTKYSVLPAKAIIRKRYKGKVYTIDVINEMAVCNPTNLGPMYATVIKVN